MICPNCKKDIDDDSRFCRFCGAEFIDEEEQIEIIPEYSGANEPSIHSAPTYRAPQKQVSTSNRTGDAKKKRTVAIQLLIVIAVLCIICGVLICIGLGTGKIGSDKEVVTDATGEEIKSGWGTVEMTVMDVDGTARVIESDKSLISPSQILEEYTAVMNQLKNDAPAFEKVRYQNLPTDKQNLGAVADMVLPIIEKYVTSKAAAESVSIASGNANNLPVKDSSYGCLLTDATAIKNAYCEIMSDDIYKIVMTFNDEMNPGHLAAGATSTTGIINGVFDPYDAAEQITAISSMVMNDIDFNYTDCTVTLVYNHKTKQVQSLDMTMNIDITADTILMEINARIVDVTEFTNFNYSSASAQ